MRVIAGTARSLRLLTPKGLHTRPTPDRIKETLFNMLIPYVPNALVLDLFAGSGGLGIEALSRGARYAFFVDNNESACKCITQNLHTTKLEEKGELIKRDALAGMEYLATLKELEDKSIDLVFIDPPYEKGYEKKVLDLLAQQKYISNETLIILESGSNMNPNSLTNEALHIEKVKLYKTNMHLFIRRRITE